MADTTNFSVRMDSEVKQQCEELFNDLGMTLTTAINNCDLCSSPAVSLP